MKVWELINEIRGENMTLEQRKKSCELHSNCTSTDFMNSKLNLIGFKIAHQFCDGNEDSCPRCMEAFLESDYDEVKHG